MCLDTVTDMNETLNTVTVYNFDAAIDLGHGFCPPPPWKKSFKKFSFRNECLETKVY